MVTTRGEEDPAQRYHSYVWGSSLLRISARWNDASEAEHWELMGTGKKTSRILTRPDYDTPWRRCFKRQSNSHDLEVSATS